MPTVIRSVDDLLDMIPHTLGFEPVDSLVTFGVSVTGGVMCARVDVPVTEEQQDDTIGEISAALFVNDVDVAAAILYTDDAQLAAELARKIEPEWHPKVTLRVHDGRYFEAANLADPGTERQVSAEVLEHVATHGSGHTAATRDDLALPIRPQPKEASVVAGAEEALAPATPDEAAWVTEALDRDLTDPAEIARLLRAMQRDALRDLAILTTRQHAHERVARWQRYAAVAPDRHRPMALALAAYNAYLDGHGALAWVCLDAIEGEPPSLARLIATAMNSALSPEGWLAEMTKIRDIMEESA